MTRLPGVLALLLLTACAGSPRTDWPVDWRDNRVAVTAIDHWLAQGKLALRSAESAESAQLQWQQKGTHTRVRLNGPLGTGATEITSDGTTLTVRRGDDLRAVDVSTPAAIRQNTGWDLPLTALPFWLKGIAQPNGEAARFTFNAETGLPSTLTQGDWTVAFERFGRFDGLTLPTRLLIEGADTRVTVIIRQWQLEQRS